MGRAKEIVMRVIPTKVATPFMKAHHYSGKVVNNSTLHFGVFLDGNLHGVMSYGPSLDKSKIIGLVKDTGWNEFLELNRMAFDSYLPRNSESRAISMSLRLIKKYAPQIKWVISFADACSCGDGTIYRASNFVLTGIKEIAAVVCAVLSHCFSPWSCSFLYCAKKTIILQQEKVLFAENQQRSGVEGGRGRRYRQFGGRV